ncbi:MAG: hypothetical protein LKM32_12520 [Chiayiivirga sp.]|jgi:hypothetical protein|uniref:DUF6116 family protein n=1 Tax=Chiayiivirga sp. TaxID=2041042 RepID=UPI0025B97899|nr:DUF6116 family protein [Chiayiivirga sp.]MCI1709545.1 hypothetical protein [Chiayiivirga sp.]MCI1730163.1 hypothetical protein [Chiayiivirga sp.]
MPHPLLAPVLAYVSKLRHPQLFKLTAALFLLDVLVPDLIPFADELLLALGTLVLGQWKRRRDPPVIDTAP